jgi:hypothetical protein
MGASTTRPALFEEPIIGLFTVLDTLGNLVMQALGCSTDDEDVHQPGTVSGAAALIGPDSGRKTGKKETRLERETRERQRAVAADRCEAYWTVDRPSCPITDTPFQCAVKAVQLYADRYVESYDRFQTLAPDEDPPDPFLRSLLSCLCGEEEQKSMFEVFHPRGEDHTMYGPDLCQAKQLFFAPFHRDRSPLRSQLKVIAETRTSWVSDIVRMHCCWMNGKTGSNILTLKNVDGVKVCGTTRFQDEARAFKLPTERDIEARMPAAGGDRNNSSHPYQAAGRYCTLDRIRAVGTRLGVAQCDSTISSSTRDAKAYGVREFKTLKDLGHMGAPRNSDTPVVLDFATHIDCLSYMTHLRKSSGRDMAIWCPWFPHLAGEARETSYYATSDKYFSQIVGDGANITSYHNQLSWDFTDGDTVYIETEDRSAFSVYLVVKYPQPNMFKQVVFLSCQYTVNLPYAVVDTLLKWSAGDDELLRNEGLRTTGISEPGPSQNVVLVPADPAKEFTRDILVMCGGTRTQPEVCVKYRDETSPTGITVMGTEHYKHFVYANANGGRALNIQEVYTRLATYCEHYQPSGSLEISSGTALYEILRTAKWFGHLPNTQYYAVSAKREDEPEPDTDNNARACPAAPDITNASVKEAPTVPIKDKGAMDAYIVDKLKGKKNTTVPTRSFKKISASLLKAWLRKISKETGIKPNSVPLVSEQEVRESRSKPAQVARETTNGLGPPEGTETGQGEVKNEVSHKDPESARVIQSPSFDAGLWSGVVAKTCEKVLKLMDAYGPGKDPGATTDGVSAVYNKTHRFQRVFSSGGVRGVDYTAADDSHSEYSNTIMRAFIEFFVTPEDMERALKGYDGCFNMMIKYMGKLLSSEWKNCSGTGITTVLNTIVFMFREFQTTIYSMVLVDMEYNEEIDVSQYDWETTFPALDSGAFWRVVGRIQSEWGLDAIDPAFVTKHGRRLTDLVYEWTGQNFGDDGLACGTPYVTDKWWERAMKLVDTADGFKRKLEVSITLLSERTEYLSRIYPDLIQSKASHCKVEKALRKLSVAINRDPVRYSYKLRGYLSNDRHCPLVGGYCLGVANTFGWDVTKPLTQEELDRLEVTDRERYWQVQGGAFPDNDVQAHLDTMLAEVGSDYGMTSAEVAEHDARLAGCSTWEELQEQMLAWKWKDEQLHADFAKGKNYKFDHSDYPRDALLEYKPRETGNRGRRRVADRMTELGHGPRLMDTPGTAESPSARDTALAATLAMIDDRDSSRRRSKSRRRSDRSGNGDDSPPFQPVLEHDGATHWMRAGVPRCEVEPGSAQARLRGEVSFAEGLTHSPFA